MPFVPSSDALVPSSFYIASLIEAWMKEGRFPAICELAFRYLDVDGDSVLSVKEHIQTVQFDLRNCVRGWTGKM